jgi:hypothetical protein
LDAAFASILGGANKIFAQSCLRVHGTPLEREKSYSTTC